MAKSGADLRSERTDEDETPHEYCVHPDRWFLPERVREFSETGSTFARVRATKQLRCA